MADSFAAVRPLPAQARRDIPGNFRAGPGVTIYQLLSQDGFIVLPTRGVNLLFLLIKWGRKPPLSRSSQPRPCRTRRAPPRGLSSSKARLANFLTTAGTALLVTGEFKIEKRHTTPRRVLAHIFGGSNHVK